MCLLFSFLLFLSLMLLSLFLSYLFPSSFPLGVVSLSLLILSPLSYVQYWYLATQQREEEEEEEVLEEDKMEGFAMEKCLTVTFIKPSSALHY